MDLHMPDLNGLEATRLIREHEKANGEKSTPIIAVTACAMSGDRDRCLNSGMTEYLSKPIDKNRLVEMLARLGAQPSPASSPAPL